MDIVLLSVPFILAAFFWRRLSSESVCIYLLFAGYVVLVIWLKNIPITSKTGMLYIALPSASVVSSLFPEIEVLNSYLITTVLRWLAFFVPLFLALILF
ncbi:hypothetical protein [Enterovibrio coralii]|uniref:hypothetical protein n=1 Tax=Enterovibrio coralii TaxID=294935 RepID=UPI0012F836F9|nr:hypothetical protein [Enterovibrio coralii]